MRTNKSITITNVLASRIFSFHLEVDVDDLVKDLLRHLEQVRVLGDARTVHDDVPGRSKVGVNLQFIDACSQSWLFLSLYVLLLHTLSATSFTADMEETSVTKGKWFSPDMPCNIDKDG